MMKVTGIAAAPSDVTMTGAMPVTRIVPARPITKAPHQFVSCLSPPPAYSSSSACEVTLHLLIDDSCSNCERISREQHVATVGLVVEQARRLRSPARRIAVSYV